MGVPTFCPIHMKIHECPENSNKAISIANETKIKAKMARMINPTITTESEKTQQAEKGTIQYILENAKKNNSTIKNKLGIESEEGRSVGIDEEGIYVQTGTGMIKILVLQPPGQEMAPAGTFYLTDQGLRLGKWFDCTSFEKK